MDEASFPPPNGVILSNLVNRLIEHPDLYTQVLKLCQKNGFSAVYECKTILPTSGNSSFSGYFQFVTTSEVESDDPNDLRSFPASGTLPKVTRGVRKISRRRLQNINIITPIVDDVEDGKSPKEVELLKISSIKDDLTMEEIQEKQVNRKDFQHFPILKDYQPGKSSHKLYVKNIAKGVTKDEILHIFNPFIKRHRVSRPYQVRYFESGKLRGQAFVTFPSKALAAAARRQTNGFMLKGKPMVVVYAKG